MQLAQLKQELVDLPGEMRVLEATEAVAKYVRLGKLELTASSVLERLGFPAARQWTPVGQLSGGERRRLQLTRLLMAEPNVLLLDEPTNDLDVDTLARLEDLLDGWPGTLVVVSHDRYLVERVCDTVVALLGDGKITHLPGGIEEYLARRGHGAERRAAPPGGRGARPPSGSPARGGAAGGAMGAIPHRQAVGRRGRGPSSGRPARKPRGWSGGWRRWRPARRRCTRRWSWPPPSQSGCWRSTPSCAASWPSARASSWSGWRRRRRPSDRVESRTTCLATVVRYGSRRSS